MIHSDNKKRELSQEELEKNAQLAQKISFHINNFLSHRYDSLLAPSPPPPSSSSLPPSSLPPPSSSLPPSSLPPPSSSPPPSFLSSPSFPPSQPSLSSPPPPSSLPPSSLLSLSLTLAQLCPDFYTLYNLRREILSHSNPDISLFKSEMELINQLLRKHQKSYSLFTHRQWVVLQILKLEKEEDREKGIIKEELGFCGKMLGLDERNFHVWNYRNWLVLLAGGVWVEKELEFTKSKIEANFTNFSALHFRAKNLGRKEWLEQWNVPSNVPSNVSLNVPLHQELEFIRTGLYIQPDEQGIWQYHRWLMESGIKNKVKMMLKRKEDLGGWLIILDKKAEVDKIQLKVRRREEEGVKREEEGGKRGLKKVGKSRWSRFLILESELDSGDLVEIGGDARDEFGRPGFKTILIKINGNTAQLVENGRWEEEGGRKEEEGGRREEEGGRSEEEGKMRKEEGRKSKEEGGKSKEEGEMREEEGKVVKEILELEGENKFVRGEWHFILDLEYDDATEIRKREINQEIENGYLKLASKYHQQKELFKSKELFYHIRNGLLTGVDLTLLLSNPPKIELESLFSDFLIKKISLPSTPNYAQLYNMIY